MLILWTQNGWKIITRISPRPRRQAPVRGLLRRRGCAPALRQQRRRQPPARRPASPTQARSINLFMLDLVCLVAATTWSEPHSSGQQMRRIQVGQHTSTGPAGRRMQPRQGPKQLMNMSCNAIYHDHPCIYTVLSLRKTEENIGYTYSTGTSVNRGVLNLSKFLLNLSKLWGVLNLSKFCLNFFWHV